MIKATQVTQLIEAVSKGEPGATDRLLKTVYHELHQMADRQMARERSGHTLQTTALVNEAYLRLFGQDSSPNWQNRAHFFSAAAEAMRRVLVEHARHKKTLRNGGRESIVPLTIDVADDTFKLDEVLDIDAALQEFSGLHARKAELVKLRYFAGLTIPQTAEVLGISVATANRDWVFAQAWLYQRTSQSRQPPTPN